jgi:hypothetical protein
VDEEDNNNDSKNDDVSHEAAQGIKERGCADGRKQREHNAKDAAEDAAGTFTKPLQGGAFRKFRNEIVNILGRFFKFEEPQECVGYTYSHTSSDMHARMIAYINYVIRHTRSDDRIYQQPAGSANGCFPFLVYL